MDPRIQSWPKKFVPGCVISPLRQEVESRNLALFFGHLCSQFWENSPFSLTWNGPFSRKRTIDQNGLFFTTGPRRRSNRHQTNEIFKEDDEFDSLVKNTPWKFRRGVRIEESLVPPRKSWKTAKPSVIKFSIVPWWLCMRQTVMGMGTKGYSPPRLLWQRIT